MSQYWKIGELAKATNLTVRTLRHYDEIGLLTPSERSESGYRLYGAEDVAKLQQIVSLKALGFSLEKIRTYIDTQEYTAQEIVTMHLSQLKDQIAWKESLCRQLEKLTEALQNRADVTTEELIRMIRVINSMDQHNFDPGFTPEEDAKLKARRKEFGEEKIREVENEWPELIAAVKAQMDAGLAPSDPEVQKNAKRWKELIDMFTGGDMVIMHKLKEAYQESPGFSADMGMDPSQWLLFLLYFDYGASEEESVEAHGGRIWAENSESGGTCLKFVLLRVKSFLRSVLLSHRLGQERCWEVGRRRSL